MPPPQQERCIFAFRDSQQRSRKSLLKISGIILQESDCLLLIYLLEQCSTRQAEKGKKLSKIHIINQRISVVLYYNRFKVNELMLIGNPRHNPCPIQEKAFQNTSQTKENHRENSKNNERKKTKHENNRTMHEKPRNHSVNNEQTPQFRRK